MSLTYPKINPIPLLLAVTLSPLVGWLVVQGNWLYAIVLIFALPVAIWLQRYPFATVIIWLIILPLIPANDSSRYLYWVVHRSLMALAISLNILERMLKIKPHPPIKLGWPDALMVGYLILSTLSLLFSQEHEITSKLQIYLFTIYDRTLVAYIAFWAIRFLAPTSQDFQRLIPLMAALVLLECIVGMLSWFYPDILPRMWQGRAALRGARVTGTFAEPAAYSSMLVFFMTFILQHAMHTLKNGWQRYGYLLLIAFGLVCIFFTFSRGSWVAMLVVFAVWGMLYARTLLPLASVGVVAMGLLLITIFNAEYNFALERLNSAQSATTRIIQAQAGQAMFLEKPIWGWGYGSYDLHDWKYMKRVGDFVPRQYEIKTGTSHNSTLTILAEMGVIGLFFYAFPILWWAIRSLQAWPHLPKETPPDDFFNRNLFLLLWANVIFVLIVGQFIDLRFFWFTLGEMWLTLGLIANYIDKLGIRN